MPSPSATFQKLAHRRLFVGPLLSLVAFSISLYADTSATTQKAKVGGCYCGCSAKSGRLGGCIKICDLPRYANRWWATTCRKPPITIPIDHPDAGPHYPHPARAERASRSPAPHRQFRP